MKYDICYLDKASFESAVFICKEKSFIIYEVNSISNVYSAGNIKFFISFKVILLVLFLFCFEHTYGPLNTFLFRIYNVFRIFLKKFFLRFRFQLDKDQYIEKNKIWYFYIDDILI